MTYYPEFDEEIANDSKSQVNHAGSPEVVDMAIPPSGYASAEPLADLESRMIAGLIDHVIIGAITLVLFFPAFAAIFSIGGSWWSLSQIWMPDFGILGWFGGLFAFHFLLWLIYFTYFEGTSGQTIGKRHVQIKVVKEDGSRCDLGSAFTRSLLRVLDYLPFLYAIGITLIVVTEKHQRMGDMFARTMIVEASA
jgi:uncharacterized RDD family membrane protein YckC